jgi:flagellar basal-body rod protein FlgC
MSLSRIFDISSTAVAAQSQRLNVVASNLANADSVSGPEGRAYRSRQVVFEARQPGSTDGVSGVRVSRIVEDESPGRRSYDPNHPQADPEGYVMSSNVNTVEEMVNMISASRSYQNNVEILNTTQQLLLKTLQLGQ